MARRAFGIVFGQPDVELLAERVAISSWKNCPSVRCRGIDAPQQLALVEPERQPVIGLPGAGFPRRLLARHHRGQPIRVRDHAAIDGLVEGKQTRLVSQELAHGDRLLAVLRELGPVRGDPLVVVQPAARVRDGQGHRRQALGGRVDDDHRVPFPGLTRWPVPDAAPEVDDLLAAEIHAAGAAELVSAREVLRESVANGLEAGSDVSVNPLRRFDDHWSPGKD